MANRITVDRNKITEYCRRWKITEFSLFGSVLRDDFRPDSDVDVLVAFEPQADWSLSDWADMGDELKVIFGRDVDLVEKNSLKNPFRRRAILDSHEVVYGSGNVR